MIEIQYDNRSVLDALQELSRRLDDMTPAMRDIAGVMADATERAFANEADPVPAPRPGTRPISESPETRQLMNNLGSKLFETDGLAVRIQSARGRASYMS